MAPGLPIANVATGTPPGICTIESRESSPLSEADSMGTPSTGSGVRAAATPARCAAPPAPAITIFRPRSRAVVPHSYINLGVRCALMTRFS